MEREAREARERASIASKARAERAARTTRAGVRQPRRRARREWQEPPDDRDSKPVGSRMPSLGRCAASPGGLSWERLGSIAFWSFPREPLSKGFTSYVSRVLESLDTMRQDHAKTCANRFQKSSKHIGDMPPERFKMRRRGVENTSQNASKSTRNGFHMAPRRPLGGPRAPKPVLE